MAVYQISFSKENISLKQTNPVGKRELLNLKNIIPLYRQTKNYSDFSPVPTMQCCSECMHLLQPEWLIIIRLNSHTM